MKKIVISTGYELRNVQNFLKKTEKSDIIMELRSSIFVTEKEAVAQ